MGVKMMRVKMAAGRKMAGPGGVVLPGRSAEVDEALGRALLRAGFAEKAADRMKSDVRGATAGKGGKPGSGARLIRSGMNERR